MFKGRRGEGKINVKKKNFFHRGWKSRDLFLFQTCFSAHMVPVLAHILGISELTRDPPSQADMISAVSV